MISERTAKSGDYGSALEKSIAVLDAVVAAARPATLAELAEAVGQPKPTVHRILRQLAALGLVIRAAGKDRYLVGPGMMRLSAASLASLSTAPPVRAVLGELVEETEETCNVGVLDQDEVLYIERVEGTSPLRLRLRVGSRVAVHCTAIGKLLTAELHKNVRTRMLIARLLRRFTANTLIDPAALEAEFARIRAAGYSYNNEEYERGLAGVAVAIRDAAGKAIGALAINAPSPRLDAETARSYLPSMHDKAARIAALWGLAVPATD